jgi:hypothetical protein
MEEVLRFFRTYEIWIYLVLALAGLLYVRKFILAWDEMRAAAFGLERESAQRRLNQSASLLVLLLFMAIGLFVAVSFIAPTFPGSNPLLTPTLNLLTTPTNTLSPEEQARETAEMVESVQTTTPTEELLGEGCTRDQAVITEPRDGSEISGIVMVRGTADIPNFGFYKYEVARPGETVWLTIQAGRAITQNADLGQWDTRTLDSGEYMLRLVVTDNQGASIEPCIIQVRVNNPVVGP